MALVILYPFYVKPFFLTSLYPFLAPVIPCKRMRKRDAIEKPQMRTETGLVQQSASVHSTL